MTTYLTIATTEVEATVIRLAVEIKKGYTFQPSTKIQKKIQSIQKEV